MTNAASSGSNFQPQFHTVMTWVTNNIHTYMKFKLTASCCQGDITTQFVKKRKTPGKNCYTNKLRSIKVSTTPLKIFLYM